MSLTLMAIYYMGGALVCSAIVNHIQARIESKNSWENFGK